MKRSIASICVLLSLTTFALLSHATPQQVGSAASINDVYVIHFVLDGLNNKAFERALSEGKLPNLTRHVIDRGALFTHALSSFPSTSTSVYQSYATGLMPGHSGIPHLERFDRQRQEVIGYLTVSGATKVNADLFNLRALFNPDVSELSPPTTIFELLHGHPTAAIYSSFQRGASFAHPRAAPIRALWSTFVTKNENRVDILAMQDVMDLFSLPKDEIPRYTLAGLYSADLAGHSFGPQSAEVQDILVQFDLFLDAFVHLLEERGLTDKTFLIVSADHGMHESGDLFAFQKALEKEGIFVKPKDPRAKGYTLYAANRGVVSSHLYVRHDGGFAPLTDPDVLRRHPTIDGEPIDLIETILGLPATDLLVVRAGDRKARLFDHEGRLADIACFPVGSTDYCSYRFDRQRGDPLGYAANPKIAKLLDGRPHSTSSWREACADERYPDAIVQFVQIFGDGRAGDAFITTRGRWGFRKVKAGNHGGPTEDDMRVPLVMAGPAVPHGTFGVARSIDLFPLLIEWFGLRVPQENYDGIDPLHPAPAENPQAAALAALEELFDTTPPLIKMVGVADFVRREVFAIAPPRKFPQLLPLARAESARRFQTLLKMQSLLRALKAQQENPDAPHITDPDYLPDHLEIVGRAMQWLTSAGQRMEDVGAVLEKCADPNAGACRSL